MSELLGLYRPGTTALHRLGAGTKLALLLVTSIVLVVVRGPWTGVAALAVALALVAWSGTGLRALVRQLRMLLVVVALLVAWQAWQNGWERAVESSTDLVALVLLATVVTTTTQVDDILDVLVRLLSPFRRFGVDPEKVALAFSLTIRALPSTLQIAKDTQEAALARGLERDPRARLVPLVIRVVAQARATGEALDARGVVD